MGGIIGAASAIGGLMGGGGPRAPRCNPCQMQQLQQFPQANMACAGHMNYGCQRCNACCNSFMGRPCGPMNNGLSSFAMAGAGGAYGAGFQAGFANSMFNNPFSGGFGGGGFGGGFGGGLPFPPGLPMPGLSLSMGVSINV